MLLWSRFDSSGIALRLFLRLVAVEPDSKASRRASTLRASFCAAELQMDRAGISGSRLKPSPGNIGIHNFNLAGAYKRSPGRPFPRRGDHFNGPVAGDMSVVTAVWNYCLLP